MRGWEAEGDLPQFLVGIILTRSVGGAVLLEFTGFRFNGQCKDNVC